MQTFSPSTMRNKDTDSGLGKRWEMTGFGLVSWETASPSLGPAIWLEVGNSSQVFEFLYHFPPNRLSSPSKLLSCLFFLKWHPRNPRGPHFQHLNVTSNHRWRSLGSLGGALDGPRYRSAVVNLMSFTQDLAGLGRSCANHHESKST